MAKKLSKKYKFASESFNHVPDGDDMASMVLRSLSVMVVVTSAVHSFCPHLVPPFIMLSVVVYQIELKKEFKEKMM